MTSTKTILVSPFHKSIHPRALHVSSRLRSRDCFTDSMLMSVCCMLVFRFRDRYEFDNRCIGLLTAMASLSSPTRTIYMPEIVDCLGSPESSPLQAQSLAGLLLEVQIMPCFSSIRCKLIPRRIDSSAPSVNHPVIPKLFLLLTQHDYLRSKFD